MDGRLNPYRLDPGSHRAARALVDHLAAGPLEPALLILVYLRASQLNACAFCLELHTRQARDTGIAQEKLELLAAWPDAPCFSEPERAALALTEAVTRLDGGVSDRVWDQVGAHFDDEQTASLLWAIAAINAFNRVNVASRFPPRSRG
jgi:AhpD family alkylhydroperoxidase